ncbi:MAG TPA: AraC family transcriptional regulator [Tepidisphaeraceae bacterium]|jgi:AraC-like DNA-binding protein|nr:AraC family transcriptional regulator [Tepidisphaeraceae bacterium]
MEQSRYYRGFLAGEKLNQLVVAPVESPAIPGFGGALHVYRSAEQGRFTDGDVRAVSETAAQFSRVAADARTSRPSADCDKPAPWVQRANSRQIVIGANFKPIVAEGLSDLDQRLSDQLHHDARHRLQQLGGQPMISDRLALPDSSGQLWNFRAVAYRSFPGLAEGAVVFYSLLPGYCEWISLRAADFSADAELSRLVPAIQFMNEHFRRGPTLGEISKHVHLSPFHFHRRFTELLGITPKHFLLECQIFYAKSMLFSRESELAEIAKFCGFAHQSHFTSRFKQFTGLTPTRWRKWALRNGEPKRDRIEVKN